MKEKDKITFQDFLRIPISPLDMLVAISFGGFVLLLAAIAPKTALGFILYVLFATTFLVFCEIRKKQKNKIKNDTS